MERPNKKMKDILNDLKRWIKQGKAVAIGTVIQTWGSAPRGVGAKMGVSADGEISGSVSGGCVEGAVVEASLKVLSSGAPQLLHFGVADESAWEVGLSCGGTIDVFVNQLDLGWYEPLTSAIQQEKTVATATIIQGKSGQLGRTLVLYEDGRLYGSLGEELDEVALVVAQEGIASGKSRRLIIQPSQKENEVDIFLDVILPSPVLVIVGGTHISIALANLAKILGFHTIIVDPRRSFGNLARFPDADQLIQSWPDQALSDIELNRSTAVTTLTHDSKLDDPALMVALTSQAFYVGALGSQKTQIKRRQRLLDAGLSESQVDRLHGPIGLDIKASTPEEIALSIMAEIVAARAVTS
jgi:xanthine dehydrogenase accessory factor